ncbi:MAG TPA: SIS domain-containing protein [Methanothermobacter sp.]|nr:6-phospho 3-hexuloisomerase [Methanothermobacter sp. MT-2]HHW05148.1 SIS domain-containing protein [Methanothermobacter sp.]HOK73340.1 SIS domain-containing protein [Methanothermobacter sp.]HOL69784.1 SIS domain-containing protein [Methanothermobacter sp.]HPQ05149.1 SIS domain-containing protein [Methanothermobacter sp.]
MIAKVIKKIMKHSMKAAENIDKKEVQGIVEELAKPRSIFILGSGRSKLIGEAFAMRLAQLELKVHVIGDSTTITPKEGDLIIVISSSGDTDTIIKEVKRLKGKGTTIIGITANKKSKLKEISEFKLYVETGEYRDYKKEIKKGNCDNLTPLGTLYEDTSLLILDGLIATLMEKLGKTEKDLAEAHY